MLAVPLCAETACETAWPPRSIPRATGCMLGESIPPTGSISMSDLPHIASIDSNAGHTRARMPCLTPLPRGIRRQDYSEAPRPRSRVVRA